MTTTIYNCLEERILVLDGGLGTMVQGFGLEEKDYRGEQFMAWDIPLKGCNDILVLTAPDIISQIHEAYLAAGADIISTDSFNANAVSLSDYKLEQHVYEINKAAASIARAVADKFTLRNPQKPRFVAGSIGPTSRTTSMSADVNDPASREVTFDDLVGDYTEQVRGLLDGGVDILLVETIFDTLNAKAAIFAIETECESRGINVPVMISGTLADASGRTLSGQVVEAFYTSVSHANPITIGFNCAYGAKQMMPYLERLSQICEYGVSAHPNAGLPNILGGYDETPQMMAEEIEKYLQRGLINIIGGCCGTTPLHIAEFSKVAARYQPRPKPLRHHITTLSGLEPLKIRPESNFINIGERANVAGSAKFAKLIREERFEEALSIARQQVEAGALIVDVCMDDGLINGPKAMTHFLNLIMSEPEISRVPIMIDSSSWETLEAGLKCVQGKSIVNSISLKEGEKEFLRKATLIRRYGATVMVMLFDESGQADTFSRKIEVAERAYNLLTDEGIPAEDIVFDPNVLTVATGIEEHNKYGTDFIEAVRWIKQNLPHAKVSGGISNLSFSFRGNNPIREAMHSVFLFHAIEAGLDMGIVNPALLQVYSEIDPELLELTEDVVLNRRADATERLTDYASRIKNTNTNTDQNKDSEKWRSDDISTRIAYAMTKGIVEYISEDTMEAYRNIGNPLEVIDKIFMPAMAKIGELFGAGKMFLPQVVKSARVMRRGVEVLTPFINQGSQEKISAGKILIATVKGDVHDIGKNIVSVVMSCNGYDVKDLGVMVETKTIVDEAQKWGADVIGLSGLISPSLEEMIRVVEELEARGMKTPVIIGGATTSDLHTAVKIAPHYSGVVVRSSDASDNISILNKLLDLNNDQYIQTIKQKQSSLREQFEARETDKKYISLAEARENRYRKPKENIITPLKTGIFTLDNCPIDKVVEYIDWNFFFPSWGIKGHYPEVLSSPEKGPEATKLFDDAKLMLHTIIKDNLLTLKGVVGIFTARSEDDNIFITDKGGREIMLAQLRNQEQQAAGVPNLSLADFISGDGQDNICLFTVSGGIGLEKAADAFRKQNDDYSAIMLKLLADRLTEAFAESLHQYVEQKLWGCEPNAMSGTPNENHNRGVRIAFGYPAAPDHSLKKEVFALLEVQENIGLSLTENYMINPGESICGIILSDKNANYFSTGKIDQEQLADYAQRRDQTPETIAKLIPQHLQK